MNSAFAFVTLALVAGVLVSASELAGAPSPAEVAATVGAIANCKSPDGNFDLTGIASGTNLAGSDTQYTYTLNLCSTVSGGDKCTTSNGAFCQYGNTSPFNYVHTLTKWDSSGAWSTCTDASNCQNGGFQVFFATGDTCGGNTGPARAVTYEFACVANSASLKYQVLPGANSCSYIVLFQNAVGCNGGSGGSGGGGGSSSKKLSGGSIFLIILVVLIPVYIAAGCIYKRQTKGTSGMESCPNIDFWRDLPALVGEGCKFTWRKLMGLCGKGDNSSYENVK